jgi:hypothetical protein
LLAAFDRPKPIGIRSDREGQVIEWDPAFAYAAIQLGLGVEVLARRGADRGPGTNLGNWVKHFFFKSNTFVNEADMERELGEWLTDLNTRPTELNGKTPVILLAEERQRLRPLKFDPKNLGLRFPVVVGPRAVVVHEGQSYTMPPESVGLVGALHLYPDRVTIVAGRYEASHPRHTQKRTSPAVLGWRPATGPGSTRPSASS